MNVYIYHLEPTINHSLSTNPKIPSGLVHTLSYQVGIMYMFKYKAHSLIIIDNTCYLWDTISIYTINLTLNQPNAHAYYKPTVYIKNSHFCMKILMQQKIVKIKSLILVFPPLLMIIH